MKWKNIFYSFWKPIVWWKNKNLIKIADTSLKTESTTDILIEQVHKFQNSYFEEHMWKGATVLKKAYCLRAYHETCSW